MNGMDIINAQGNYDQGRGRDGLGFTPFILRRSYSRYGTGTPMSNRPGHITGKPKPAASLDPQQVLPRIGVNYAGRTDYTREELLKRFPGYSGPMATTSPITWTPKPKPFSMLTDAEKRLRILGTPILPGTIDKAVSVPIITIDQGGVPIPRRARVRTPAARTKPNKGKMIRNRQAFINWIKNWAPEIYAAAKLKADRVEASDGTLGQLAGWWDTFSDTLADLGGKYLQFKTQKEILEAQLERMRAGEPPLQTSEYAPTIAIKPDPGTTREITGAIGAGFGKMLPWIAIAGVGVILLMRR